MGNVHELDHIKIDSDDQPQSSSSKPNQLIASLNRSIHTSKINFKLEYYLTLISSSKGAALLKLIDDLLGSEGVYVFAELLNTQPIKELCTHPTDSGYHELLEIFAYATWKQYRERQDRLPKLNENQTRKLKLLSLVHRAARSRIIPYNELLEELEISDTQDLEELTIEGIYSNLIKGRIDQKYSRLEVESCMGRDVLLNSIDFSNNKNTEGDVDMDSHDLTTVSTTAVTISELYAKLLSWSNCIGKVLNQLDIQIEQIREKDRIKLQNEAAQIATVESVAQTIFANLPSSSHNNNLDQFNRHYKGKEEILSSDHLMDIDDHDLVSHPTHKTRKRTRP